MTKKTVGVERLARPDHVVPPADVVRIVGVVAGDVVRRVQRVADEDGIRPVRVQLAVGLIGEFVARRASGRRRAAAVGRNRRTGRRPDPPSGGTLADGRGAGGLGGRRRHGCVRIPQKCKKPGQPLSASRAVREQRTRASALAVFVGKPWVTGSPAPASWVKSARTASLAVQGRLGNVERAHLPARSARGAALCRRRPSAVMTMYYDDRAMTMA